MWTDKAKCLGHDTNIFFDIYEDNPQIRNTIDNICGECPVRRKCFATGVSENQWGVWGGIYLEDGQPSKEFNSHKSKTDWHNTWQSLTMEK